ncbi:hypothetical protein TI05_03290 [Achromatium sp. WMS3]|nr:hypothetical protein TI05_03290 [Achromatium sp. WMS3]
MKFHMRLFYILFITFLVLVSDISNLKAAQSYGSDPVYTRGIKIVAANRSGKFEEINLYDKVHAVIIGIDHYPHIPQNQQLDHAVSDAKAVERLLRKKYIFHSIHTLYDEQATRKNILDLFEKLQRVSKNDAIFVFYAGHGGQDPTQFGDNIGYIAPYDGGWGANGYKINNISMTLLRTDISKKIPAKHIFYVMDVCYGGLLLETRAAKTPTRRNIDYLRTISSEPVRQVLTAGGPNEQVLDDGPKGGSVFAGRFLEILDNADDFITASEISSQVGERVFSDAQTRGHKQNPRYGKLWGLGDFVFMPSKIGRIDSISKEIAALEQELQRLEQRKTSAIQAHQEQKQREIQRQKAVKLAKLEAKKKERERLAAKIEQERLKAQRAAKEAERLKKEKAAAEVRLAEMKKKVEQKRAQMQVQEQSSSLEAAVAYLIKLNKDIEDLRRQFREETKKRILAVLDQHKHSYTEPELVKDEFETQAEYEARIKQITAANPEDNKRTFAAIAAEMEKEYRKLIEPFVQQMQAVAKQKFLLRGQDQTEVILGQYSPEKARFPVTVKTRGLAEPLALHTAGFIKVPRKNARQFKQNYVNGFITAELVAQPVTEQAIIPVAAVVIDDTNDMRYDLATAAIVNINDMRYDLFDSPFVELGNDMVFDTKSNIIWWTKGLKGRHYDFCKSLNWQGILGWRVPTKAEAASIYGSTHFRSRREARAGILVSYYGGWYAGRRNYVSFISTICVK